MVLSVIGAIDGSRHNRTSEVLSHGIEIRWPHGSSN